MADSVFGERPVKCKSRAKEENAAMGRQVTCSSGQISSSFIQRFFELCPLQANMTIPENCPKIVTGKSKAV
jgi:hypothetical protein